MSGKKNITDLSLAILTEFNALWETAPRAAEIYDVEHSIDEGISA